MQQQGNSYDCGLYCYAFSKCALQRHEDLKACNGLNDDRLNKIHGILVEGYEDSIKPLLLRKEMYGHMQGACKLDEMEASKASKDVQTARHWRYTPNVLNVISSKEKKNLLLTRFFKSPVKLLYYNLNGCLIMSNRSSLQKPVSSQHFSCILQAV